MGHVVNPIIFRVGLNRMQTWNSLWFYNFKPHYLKYVFEDYFIIQYILFFFKFLTRIARNVKTVPYINKKETDIKKMKFKKRIFTANSLISKLSFIISHIKIGRLKKKN